MPFRNPFTGKLVPKDPPDAAALAAENAWVATMKREIVVWSEAAFTASTTGTRPTSETGVMSRSRS